MTITTDVIAKQAPTDDRAKEGQVVAVKITAQE